MRSTRPVSERVNAAAKATGGIKVKAEPSFAQVISAQTTRITVLSSHSARTTLTPQAVYAAWADPAAWPQWNPEVREVTFTGPARMGSTRRLRPASGPATAFLITALELDRVFTSASSMPGATLTFEHVVESAMNGADVTVTVTIDGFLAWLWRRVVGTSLANAARSSVEGLLAHVSAA